MKNTRQLFVYRILKYVYGFDLVGEVASYSSGVEAVGGVYYQRRSPGNCILWSDKVEVKKERIFVFFDKIKSGYSIKFKTILNHVQEDQLETIKQRVAKIYPEAKVDIYNRHRVYSKGASIPTLRLRLPKLP